MPDPLPQLEIAIRHAARAGRIAEDALRELAIAAGVDLLATQQAACRAGIWPARYARNARQLSLRDQLALLQSRVLLVGLGGLGGWLLEQLVRMGVGVITGVDGDCFEESNLNRQSLGNTAQLGQSKAEAAAARVAGINPAVHFTPVPRFADKILLIRLLRGMDLALDALGGLLESIGVAGWLYGLIMDGIVAGVGAVLGFVPQMLVLFFLLSILEDVGYMARVAFIMDRIFRRFGLSGKSFIPILVGTGCGVPGVMASRTIENERDRRMTIMTTCFIPCGAKMPIIGLIAGALFGGSSWVATSAYFIGFAAIIISGIILKKTKLFAGDPAPFVMELPAYHVPAWGNVLRATWERGWSFIKRAGTVILAATIILWFLQGFGFENGAFGMVEDQDNSILAIVASAISWIFIPQGFGNWRATVASISGLIAKENVVGTFGVLYHYADELSDNGDEIWPEVAASFTALSAYSFMIFNLLCAPCFAAMGAIKREMNNGKWTAIAIGYMCLFAYCASLVVYQIGGLITGEVSFNFFTIVAVAIIAMTIYLLFRPNKYEGVNEVQFNSKKAVASK